MVRSPLGLPPAEGAVGLRFNVDQVADEGRGLGHPTIMQEVERYQLDIVGLTSTDSLDSGTKLLERG